MNKWNYYKLLELPLEKKEVNLSIIDTALNAKRKEWSSYKGSKMSDGERCIELIPDIQEAMNDTTRWNNIYQEAFTETNKYIDMQLLVLSSKGYVTVNEIKNIALKSQTTEKYVDNIRSAKKIKLSSSQNTVSDTIKEKRFSDLTTNNVILTYRNVENNLLTVSCSDLYEFLTKYNENETSASSDNAPSELADLSKSIATSWRKKRASALKAAVIQICSSCNNTFSTLENKKNYDDYCQYKKGSLVLEELGNIFSNSQEQDKIINVEVENAYISRLTQLTGSRKESKEYLTTYCNDKNIRRKSQTEVQSNNNCVCPLCNSTFTKETPMQKTCPICRGKLEIECPKCGKIVNLAISSTCQCSFNLDQYPRMQNLCQQADEAQSRMNFELAENIIKDVEKIWPKFPDIQNVEIKIKDHKRLLEPDIKRLKDAIQKKAFYSAKKIYDQLNKSGYENTNYQTLIDDKISTADAEWNVFQKTSLAPEKIKILNEICDMVSDHLQANTALNNFPIYDVTKIDISLNIAGSTVQLLWTSGNLDNTVKYVILRKEYCSPMDYNDGVVIGETSQKGFSDNSIKSGIPYYYAVFAQRGNQKSHLKSVSECMVLVENVKEIQAAANTSSVNLVWKNISNSLSVEVYRDEKKRFLQYGDGYKLTNVNKMSAIDDNLKSQVTYYYTIYTVCIINGTKYHSTGVSVSVTPVEPPCVIKKLTLLKSDIKDNYTIAFNENIDSNTIVQFYKSSKGLPFNKGSVISKNDIDANARLFSPSKIADKKYEFNILKNDIFYLTVVTIKSNTVVIGDTVRVANVEEIRITDYIISGNDLFLRIEEWPSKTSYIHTLFRQDKYPIDYDDEEALLIKTTEADFRREKALIIKSYANTTYYFSFYALQAGCSDMTFIGNCKCDLSEKFDLKYYFSYSQGFLGRSGNIKLVIEAGKPFICPELDFRIRGQARPLRNIDGESLYKIPLQTEKKKKFEFNIPYKVAKDTYGSLFLTKEMDKNSFTVKLEMGKNSKIY